MAILCDSKIWVCTKFSYLLRECTPLRVSFNWSLGKPGASALRALQAVLICHQS